MNTLLRSLAESSVCRRAVQQPPSLRSVRRGRRPARRAIPRASSRGDERRRVRAATEAGNSDWISIPPASTAKPPCRAACRRADCRLAAARAGPGSPATPAVRRMDTLQQQVGQPADIDREPLPAAPVSNPRHLVRAARRGGDATSVLLEACACRAEPPRLVSNLLIETAERVTMASGSGAARTS